MTEKDRSELTRVNRLALEEIAEARLAEAIGTLGRRVGQAEQSEQEDAARPLGDDRLPRIDTALEEGDYVVAAELAETLADDAVELQMRALVSLAEARIQLRDWEDALDTLDTLLDLAPTPSLRAWIQGNRCRMLAKLGEPIEALAAADEAVALEGDEPDPMTLLNRALALSGLGRVADALAQTEAAAALDPDNGTIDFDRAGYLVALGRAEEGFEFAERAFARRPELADLALSDRDVRLFATHPATAARFASLLAATRRKQGG